MDDSIALVAVLVIGMVLGAWLEGRAPATRKRVFKATGIVLGVPAVLIVLASVVQSDTLGWIGGLSLMVLLLHRHGRARAAIHRAGERPI